jgi:plasmid maintenance system antidote protein VapI
MYKNLVAEIAINSISKKEVSQTLGITHNTLARKVKGDTAFTVPESKKLLTMFKGKSFEYLFAVEQ